MIPFDSSSRRDLRHNVDGSRSVYCYQCGEFITTTLAPISTALCAMCKRIEDGEEVTIEMMTEYRLSKRGRVDVSMLLLPKDEMPKALGIESKKFSLRSLGNAIMSAVGLAKPAVEVPQSVKISKEKKRKRLFENVDLEGK